MELEERQRELVAELEKPETYASGRAFDLNRDLMTLQEELEEAVKEWELCSAESASPVE